MPQTHTERWIGTDESGKGDYFGPLVVAGVCVDPTVLPALSDLNVRDSKRISDAVVIRLAAQVRELCPHSIVAIGPKRYNELYQKIRNLNRLLAWAHARSIENLLEEVECARAVTDQFGDERFVLSALMRKGKDISLEQRPKAEDDPAVAAASILARAEFLQRLERLSGEVGIPLLKGASQGVEDTARSLVRRYDGDILKNVAKLHFRTTAKVLKEAGDRRQETGD